ncbi:hypothetical protein OPV22_007141 [Ensete ventricosum]|uniref:Uncharacterized protein n=1 Tax=Ensete ventricosum TaxID=4639 RepID=A0AAV8RSM1_ENSVE|nr:hypothetical protein OPV22_007141 [Ensete ventricosum]
MRLLSLLSHAARRSGSSSWDLASTARERQRTAAAAKRFLRAKESGMSAWRKEMHNTPPQTAPQLSLRRGWKGPKCSGKDRRFMRTVFEVYLGRLSIFLYKKTTKNAYIWVACEDTACGTAGDIDGWHSLGHKAEVEPTGTAGSMGSDEFSLCFWFCRKDRMGAGGERLSVGGGALVGTQFPAGWLFNALQTVSLHQVQHHIYLMSPRTNTTGCGQVHACFLEEDKIIHPSNIKNDCRLHLHIFRSAWHWYIQCTEFLYG